MEYFIYMLRCEDNSIYTGITNDINKRLKEHITQNKKCAKYTKTHKVIKIEALFKSSNRSYASTLECKIKRLKKIEKENIIKDNKLIYKYLDINKENYIDIPLG